MGMKSARFIAQELVNYTTKDVYEIWKDMGLVVKNKFGDWVITELGRSIGGRMSKGNHLSVPIFDSDKIIDMMIDFYKKQKESKTMALIKCPECRQKVSDKCGNCPNCGYPIEVKEEIAENNNVTVEEKTVNKKIMIGTISVAVAFILIVISTLLGLTHFNGTWKDATHNFNVVSNKLERMNDELDSLIQKSENLVETKDKALDEEKRAILKGTISDAKQARKEVSKKPLLAKDIEAATNMMDEVDYTEIVKSLEEKYNDFEKSIKQYKLVDNPTEEYLLTRLKTVKGIFNITAYTEETDTDKYLNKAKWYYSKIVFQHEDVKHLAIEYGHSIEEVGNPAGGCVEAFKTVEDAERRNQELQSQEGTVRSPGTHKVIGTVLVRTSDDLTTTKQKELEQAIIDALTYIEDVDNIKEPTTEDKPVETKPTTVPITPSNNEPTTTTNKNQQAVKTAEEIAEIYATVSPTMVKEILMNDYGFTETQANYGVKNANIDWNLYAIAHLKEYFYMNGENATKNDAEIYLETDKGYSDATIKYAFANADIDWTPKENNNLAKCKLTLSDTNITIQEECVVTAQVSYDDGEFPDGISLTADYDDSIVKVEWGNWNGKTITCKIIPIQKGCCSIKVYINEQPTEYKTIIVNVE